MDDIQIKLSSEEIKNITKSLAKSDQQEVVKYWTEWVDKKSGLCGDHAILNVTLRLEKGSRELKHVTLFMKAFPSSRTLAEFAEGTGAFKKEIFMYDLFQKFHQGGIEIIKSSVPECYYKRDDLLVMTNLLKENYRILGKREILNYETLKAVLQSLARLHSSSLIYEEKLSVKLHKPYRLIDDYESEFDESYFNDRENHPNIEGIEAAITGILNLIEIFNLPRKLLSGNNFKIVLEKVCREVFNLVKPSKKYRNVACHGDLWITNFLIKYQGNEVDNCKFVDFQCGRYAPPANDVMSLIYLTSSREFRNKFMYDLIGIYYNELEKHVKLYGVDLKNLIPFSDFLSSCEEQKQFALVETAIYFPLILLSDEQVDKYFSAYELYRKSLYEDRSLLVVENLKDEGYIERIKESIEDLKDFCDYL